MRLQIPREAMGNPRVSFSRLGYHAGRNGSFERRMGSSEFPRLHVYLADKSEYIEVSLHLDMKPHTYEGFRAHQAEHESDIVKEEGSRILAFFRN